MLIHSAYVLIEGFLTFENIDIYLILLTTSIKAILTLFHNLGGPVSLQEDSSMTSVL